MADDLSEARRRRQQKRATPPRNAGGLTGAKQARANRVLAKVDAAEERRDPAAFYAGQSPTPQRITTALDMRQMYGPEVDQALGGEEPMVDEWESGALVPTFEQMQRLAVLTGFPVKFFYQPPSPPLTGGWLCGSDGGTDRRGRRGRVPDMRQAPLGSQASGDPFHWAARSPARTRAVLQAARWQAGLCASRGSLYMCGG